MLNLIASLVALRLRLLLRRRALLLLRLNHLLSTSLTLRLLLLPLHLSLFLWPNRLGYLLTFAEGSGETAQVFVTIILLTVIGIALYALVVLVEKRVLHYLPARARLAT